MTPTTTAGPSESIEDRACRSPADRRTAPWATSRVMITDGTKSELLGFGLYWISCSGKATTFRKLYAERFQCAGLIHVNSVLILVCWP